MAQVEGKGDGLSTKSTVSKNTARLLHPRETLDFGYFSCYFNTGCLKSVFYNGGAMSGGHSEPGDQLIAV